MYLGKYNSPESRAEYGRIVAELALAPVAHPITQPSATVTVDQVVLAFLRHAERHYRDAEGNLTDQVTEFKNAVRPLHALYGHTPAKDFGPLALKAVRKAFVGAGNARTVINSRVGKIKRVFKCAVSEQLVPVATFQALTTVCGLEKGRTEAKETAPVRRVHAATVGATLPFLNRHVRGLVEFQRLTGCRPGEACRLRRCDLDTSGPVWLYRPPAHKTAWKGQERVIAVGARAQELLRGFFTNALDEYLFSPARAVDEVCAERIAARRTPRYPSHMARNARKRVGVRRKRPPAARYNRRAYLTALTRACDRAFPPEGELARLPGESVAKWEARLGEDGWARAKAWRREHRWHPNPLRHAFATAVRKRFGLEAAQVALGHARADVTQIYAEKDTEFAITIAAEIG